MEGDKKLEERLPDATRRLPYPHQTPPDANEILPERSSNRDPGIPRGTLGDTPEVQGPMQRPRSGNE